MGVGCGGMDLTEQLTSKEYTTLQERNLEFWVAFDAVFAQILSIGLHPEAPNGAKVVY